MSHFFSLSIFHSYSLNKPFLLLLLALVRSPASLAIPFSTTPFFLLSFPMHPRTYSLTYNLAKCWRERDVTVSLKLYVKSVSCGWLTIAQRHSWQISKHFCSPFPSSPPLFSFSMFPSPFVSLGRVRMLMLYIYSCKRTPWGHPGDDCMNTGKKVTTSVTCHRYFMLHPLMCQLQIGQTTKKSRQTLAFAPLAMQHAPRAPRTNV